MSVGHRWTPGWFDGGHCQVLLTRGRCPYPEDQHEPGPPEDTNFRGVIQRPGEPEGEEHETIRRPSCGSGEATEEGS